MQISKKVTRELQLNVTQDDKVELAFASSFPVERGGYSEVLDLNGMSLSRLNNKAQVLFNHDPDDYIGVVENARVDADGIARAEIRFASNGKAKEIEADVRSGILSLVSFGYFINDYEMRGADTVVVTDFEPFEISIVTIPADPTVGVGRSIEEQTTNETIEIKEIKPMETVEKTVDFAAQERKRIQEIQNIGEKFGQRDIADQFVNNGKSVDEFRNVILERMNGVTKIESESPEIGLTEKEARSFSLAKVLRALSNPESALAQKEAAFEFEASRAVQEKLGKSARGIMLPFEVMNRSMSVGTDANGGNSVQTMLETGSMIDLLRNKSYMMQLATVLTGLQGDLSVLRQNGGATGYWVAEDGELTTSQATFDLVGLTPKSLGGTTYATRKLLLQSDLVVDSFIQQELAKVLALEIDRAAINGSGASNQPTGILNTSGVGSVAIGTNGGAISRNAIIDLESAITSANADLGNMRYITNAKVRGAMRKTNIDAGSGQFLLGMDNMLLGYDALFSNQVPSNLTKGTSSGVCSAMVFGNFSDLLIGMWSGIDIVVDPYTHAKKGGLEITAFQDVDIAVRHPESFAVIKDITTA